MKTRLLVVGAALAALVPGPRLRAQDVTVGEVGWFRAEGVPEQPPQARHKLRVDYPDELRKFADVGYVIISRYVGADGQGMDMRCRATHPLFQRAVEKEVGDWKMRAAVRDGHVVPTQFWIPVIFNPGSASPDRPDATPRLLAVAPVIVKTKPPGGEAPVWATISLDAAGTPASVGLESPEDEVLRPAIDAALKHWHFAPARTGGQPVAARLRVAFLCYPPMNPVPLSQKPPRVLSQEKPIYPHAQVANGMRGEVRLEFVVDRTGQVVNPVVVRSSNPAFDQPAIAALLKWKFEPAQVDGRAVNARMVVPMIFELEFEGGGGREAFAVEKPGRKAQDQLPEALRYDTPPKARGAVDPVFPYGPLRDGEKGKATVAFAVDVAGRVVETRIIAASRPEFGLALVAAVEEFRFDPALKDGRPVPAAIRIEQEFDRNRPSPILSDDDWSLLKREMKRPGTITAGNRLDAPLKPLSRRPPVFPLALRHKAEQGSATIEALIDERGRVRLPRVVEASDPAFGYAAVQAIAGWLFEPPRAEGKPAVVRVQVPFAFELRPPRAKESGEPPKPADQKP